ncbi:MAG: 1-deoxy-D-xylulose-5-phosphate synthase [Clostridia bacterium]|nr:1-deoxy-D-xylulose-5-phosphate synthase [Clostridia bacterium]
MNYEILDKINSTADLKALGAQDMDRLCEQIRAFLLEKVEKSGGHLASNLGVVELSVALHRVFDSPTDHIIFDVGHQAYVHKILTGRKERFDELRIPGGLSGFTLMRESEHDAFGAGHSSTSISAALGYAESDRLRGKDSYTVAVIGDGAYTGGMVHEAINNCTPELRLVIVLNENGMSISTNKGAFASYLSRVRMSKGYIGVKEKTTSFLERIPLIGRPIKGLLSLIKKLLKKIFFRSNYFEDLGLYYLGPIDGNDYKRVEKALSKAKRLNKCVLVHLKTTKGKGCDEAEESPESYHSVSASSRSGSTFHAEFAKTFLDVAGKDKDIVAITAAMGIGTGLDKFGSEYPDRYFDVGIAEEHALTFAAGLAATGLKPYAAIYSTFLQRGYDNILHDIALQRLPVRIMIDRAGIAPSDGATHHGIFDVAFLSHVPGFEIYSPATYESLDIAVRYSASVENPIAIRYPNAGEDPAVRAFFDTARGEKCGFVYDFDPSCAPKNILITYGTEAGRTLAAVKLLRSRGIPCGVIITERIKPYAPLVDFIASFDTSDTHILYAEEGIKNGGAAMITRSLLTERGVPVGRFDIAAIDDDFVSPTERCDIYDYAGLSAEKLASFF